MKLYNILWFIGKIAEYPATYLHVIEKNNLYCFPTRTPENAV